MGLPYGQPLARAPHILFLLQNVIIKQDFLFFVRILENPLCKQIYRKVSFFRKEGNFPILYTVPLFPSLLKENLQRQKRNGMTTNTFCRFAIPISSWGNFCHFSCPHFVSTTIGMEALNCQEEKSLSTHSDYGKNESVNCQAAEEQRRRTTAKCQEWNYANYLHLGAVRDSRI